MNHAVSIACNFKKHPTIGIKAMFFEKGNTVLSRIQPFRALFNIIVEKSHQPCESTKYSNRLVDD